MVNPERAKIIPPKQKKLGKFEFKLTWLKENEDIKSIKTIIKLIMGKKWMADFEKLILLKWRKPIKLTKNKAAPNKERLGKALTRKVEANLV